VGHRAGLEGRKISSPPGFDPGPFSPYSVAIPTELPDPHNTVVGQRNSLRTPCLMLLKSNGTITFLCSRKFALIVY